MIPVGHHHVDRGVLHHVGDADHFAFDPQLFRHHGPSHHRANINAVLVLDRRHQQVQCFRPHLNHRLARQVFWVVQDAPLIAGILVIDIDGTSDHLLHLAGQVGLDGFQRLHGFRVEIDQLMIQVAHHHVDRGILHHVGDPGHLIFKAQLLGHHGPSHHRANINAVLVLDRRHQQVQCFRPHLNHRLARQVFWVVQDAPLIAGILVIDIDGTSDHLLHLAGQVGLDGFQRLHGFRVEIDQLMIQVAHHHVDRGILHHVGDPGHLIFDS